MTKKKKKKKKGEDEHIEFLENSRGFCDLNF